MKAEQNRTVAANLRELADLLEQQGSDRFRVVAYRRAARSVEELSVPLSDIFEKSGSKGLIALPNIGQSIAAAIAEMLQSGSWALLQRLRGTLDAQVLFQTIPGIGPKLASQLHNDLHIDSLEAMESAAWDGRLAALPRVGSRRLAMVRATLSERLGRRRIRPFRLGEAPEVATLIEVDFEYRHRAAEGSLTKIAPKRYNPKGESWMPILHTVRGDWVFSVLFSNTRRAHELNMIHDWVVIYYHTDSDLEDQCTIVTENRGPLIGKRVVRGREIECRTFYANQSPSEISRSQ